MKVLFLDIDGVLNSMDNARALYNLWELDNTIKSRDTYGTLFDERCVRWLTLIIKKTDCKIVISSTWRFSGLQIMKDLWKDRNLPGEIIDITPTTQNEELINLYAEPSADRGYEIQEWLDNNKYDSYCIVDDDSDMLGHQNFVQTNPKIGLTSKTAFAIINKLNT